MQLGRQTIKELGVKNAFNLMKISNKVANTYQNCYINIIMI